MLCFIPWCKAKCATYEHTGGCFRCRSQHEDLDLVDVETFYQEAPTDISCPVCSCLQIKQYVVMYCMSCMWSSTVLRQTGIVLVVLSCKLHHLYFCLIQEDGRLFFEATECTPFYSFWLFLIHRTTGVLQGG